MLLQRGRWGLPPFCTGRGGSSLPVGLGAHPGSGALPPSRAALGGQFDHKSLTHRRQYILTIDVQAILARASPWGIRVRPVPQLVLKNTRCHQQPPRRDPTPSHPIPSHPIPSYPAPHLIPPHPIPRFGHNEHAQRAHTTRRRDAQAASTGAQTVATVTCQVPRRAKCQGEPSAKAPGRRTHEESRTSTASTRSEHTQRDDETHRQIPRKHGRNDHVPSAKACQVPRRAKCQGARPVSHHDETQHASTSDGPTRATGTHDDSQRPGRTCQVPRRAEQQKAMQLAHIHVGNAMRLGDLRAMHGSDARRTGCEAVHLAREGVRMVARAVERGRGRRGEGGPPYFSSALRNCIRMCMRSAYACA